MKTPNVSRCVLCGTLVAALGRHGARELDDLTKPHECGPGAPTAASPQARLNQIIEDAARGSRHQ